MAIASLRKSKEWLLFSLFVIIITSNSINATIKSIITLVITAIAITNTISAIIITIIAIII